MCVANVLLHSQKEGMIPRGKGEMMPSILIHGPSEPWRKALRKALRKLARGRQHARHERMSIIHAQRE